jgi:hypothetical protein
MDGQSRGKLVAAGYRIYRSRDIYQVTGNDYAAKAGLPADAKAKPVLQIREMSEEKGHWGLYDTYPTKAARDRAWKELSKGEKNLMDGLDGDL